MRVDSPVRANVLTTRQRNVLLILLEASAPLKPAVVAARLGMTVRQVNYDLKVLARSLANKDAALRITPHAGAQIDCTLQLRAAFSEEFTAARDFDLILSNKQRQQLLAFLLLTAQSPYKLSALQQKTRVSRTTIIKDLKYVETWCESQGVVLESKPNFGVHIKAGESARRQALTQLLWEGAVQNAPLVHLTHVTGLTSALTGDPAALPIFEDAHELMRRFDTRNSLALVAEAEAQLGGRFSDDAVLYLALAFAIQAERVQANRVVPIDPDLHAWLKRLDVWEIAARLVSRLSSQWPARASEAEIAWVCMYLLSAPRNEGWPGDMGIGIPYVLLVDEVMHHVAAAYGRPRLARDQMLRDGIVNHVIPACLRQRFSLPMTALLQPGPLTAENEHESAALQALRNLISERIDITLPERENGGLALLLRAAYIRECQDDERSVIVVCPSGMATAQLLVARLKVYFPRLGGFRVVPLRDLMKEKLVANQLIIATIPLPEEISRQTSVIQVHPLLLPADIERITRELARTSDFA